MTTTVYLAPTFGAGYQAFATTGLPLNAGLIYTYAASGTTPTATYTTSAGSVQNANPIVLDADGRTPSEVWLVGGTAYRFDLKDSAGNLIKTYDNLYGIGDPGAANSAPGPYTISSVGGTANAITGTVSVNALAIGQQFLLTPASTSTAATTINLTLGTGSTTGTKNAFAYGVATTGGELKISVPALLEWDGTQLNIINPQPIVGSFTATLTGCTTSPTYTVKYTKIGNQVTLMISDGGANITGTSNAVTKTLTGMPPHLYPSATRQWIVQSSDNSGSFAAAAATLSSAGVIAFFTDIQGTGWTASGTAAVRSSMITYTTA